MNTQSSAGLYAHARLLIRALTLALILSTLSGSPVLGQGSDSVTALTEWSAPIDGFRFRVHYSPTLTFTDPINLILELRGDSAILQNVLAQHDEDPRRLSARLLMTSLSNGYTSELNVPVYRRCPLNSNDTIMPAWHHDDSTWTCNANFMVAHKPREVVPKSFKRHTIYYWDSLRSQLIHESLPIDKYHCHIEFLAKPREDLTWSGMLISKSFNIEIESAPEDLVTRTFVFPTKWHLDKGPVLAWDNDALDTVSVAVCSKYFLEYSIRSQWGNPVVAGLPEPPALPLNPNLPPTFSDLSLVFEPTKRLVFEDSILAVDFEFNFKQLMPYSGVDCWYHMAHRQELLWQGSFADTIRLAEFDSLVLSENDLYDFHTVILPAALNQCVDDALLMEFSDSLLREFRIPKGYSIEYKVQLSGDHDAWIASPNPTSFHPMRRGSHMIPASTVFPDTITFSYYAVKSGVRDPDGFTATNHVLLWSGIALTPDSLAEHQVTETYSQTIPEPWRMHTYYEPREFRLTKDMQIVPVQGDSIEVAMFRRPGTALIAEFSIHDGTTEDLPSDLWHEEIEVAYASAWPDSSLHCALRLVEIPLDGSDIDERTVLWTHYYKMKLTRKQARKLRKLNQKNKPNEPAFPSFIG